MTSLQESREADDKEDEVNPEFEGKEDQVVTALVALVTAAPAPVVPAPVVAAHIAQVVIAIAPIVVTAVVPALAVAIAPAAPDIVDNFDGFVAHFFTMWGIAPSEDCISSWAYV